MKILSIIIFVFLCPICFSQEKLNEETISAKYKAWQSIIPTVFKSSEHYYLYLTGKNNSIEKWSDTKLDSSKYFLSHKIVYIKNAKLGFVIYNEYYTQTGDWFIVQEDYYLVNGKLIFTDWVMNTVYAEYPITVEKKMYFNENGNIQKKYTNTFRLNTKEIVQVDFLDHEVNYKTDISDLEFIKYFHLIY